MALIYFFLRLKCAACFTEGAGYLKAGHLLSSGYYYVPLTNRVRGPYCKLRTEFFYLTNHSARTFHMSGKSQTIGDLLFADRPGFCRYIG